MEREGKWAERLLSILSGEKNEQLEKKDDNGKLFYHLFRTQYYNNMNLNRMIYSIVTFSIFYVPRLKCH